MKVHEQLLEDYLRTACRIKDPRILNAAKRVLSAREQAGIEPHASIVTKDKLVVVVKCPGRLKEIIIIGKGGENAEKPCRYYLTLKRK